MDSNRFVRTRTGPPETSGPALGSQRAAGFQILRSGVYPDVMNCAIVKEDIRTRIQAAIYVSCH